MSPTAAPEKFLIDEEYTYIAAVVGTTWQVQTQLALHLYLVWVRFYGVGLGLVRVDDGVADHFETIDRLHRLFHRFKLRLLVLHGPLNGTRDRLVFDGFLLD